jgi:hypothetical protein
MNSNKIWFWGILFSALVLRLYFINFGLPHSFYADEPEFTEPAINYTFQLRSIIANNDWYKLIPISYVYGTLPVYMLTFALMVFSKIANVLHFTLDKTAIFIFFRILMVTVSLGILGATAILHKKFAKNVQQKVTGQTLVILSALIAFNYKFIVHAHYVNADAILTLIVIVSFIAAWYYNNNPTNVTLIIMGMLFGLAVGTKITALISVPFFVFLIIKKRDLYGLPSFFLSSIIAFIITNPFSLVFFTDFAFRIYTMLTKEAGMVFDSVDYSPFKYLLALNNMVTLPILLLSIYAMYVRMKNTEDKIFDIFLIGNFAIYLLFFSVQSRRVDRWLLPVLPVVLIYASIGIQDFLAKFDKKLVKSLALIVIFGVYLYFPILLLTQFKRWTPKSEAYLWADANLPELATKLVYTEEGLDPMNKLGAVKVKQFNVYATEGAHLEFPEDPLKYDYVILSSRPMENFRKDEVIKAYPTYAKAWADFENAVENEKNFTLIKDFTNTKPNLIPLSDVYIYKRK